MGLPESLSEIGIWLTAGFPSHAFFAGRFLGNGTAWGMGREWDGLKCPSCKICEKNSASQTIYQRMRRTALRVLPGFPHHVTQRGTDRQIVFYAQRDRRVYLDLLKEYSRQCGVGILAYCLMRNHIHLIAVPEEEESLAVCLRRTHGRYAQYLNARRVRSGHLWQSRFNSCAMEENHLWSAIRYVEKNPARAGLVEDAESYRWSSAVAHLSGKDTSHLLDMEFWQQAGGAERWRDLLATPGAEAEQKRLRSATYSGKPLGSEDFVARVTTVSKGRREPGLERIGAGQAQGGPALAVVTV